MSNLQADGSWGPATWIPELTSTSPDNRPSLRRDGLEIFFYSGREPRQAGSTAGSADLWTATRPSVDKPWSAPVNVGATVNSINNDIHPSLSSDGRTLVFASTRLGGSGNSDLYTTTRAQVLPSTKDDCKNGAWDRFGIFKNQGDCVSYIATQGGNQPG